MNNTEAQYRQEWATKAGRPASEVYVPEALRGQTLASGGRVRILISDYERADVFAGDILTVAEILPGIGEFRTNTPRLLSADLFWSFPLSGEGFGWERVQ